MVKLGNTEYAKVDIPNGGASSPTENTGWGADERYGKLQDTIMEQLIKYVQPKVQVVTNPQGERGKVSITGKIKYDEGKPKFSLIPPDTMYALAKEFTEGEKKYPGRNWEGGMEWSRIYDSMMRHAMKWWNGQEKDTVDNHDHITAMAWNAIVLLTYVIRGIGIDDRPQGGAEIV